MQASKNCTELAVFIMFTSEAYFELFHSLYLSSNIAL